MVAMNSVFKKLKYGFNFNLIKSFDSGQFPIQIDITNSCNLRCSHCYHSHHNNTGNLNTEEWKAVINQYGLFVEKYNHKASFMICGGEPLSSPHLFPLLDKISDEYPESMIFVLTNGTLITSSLALKLRKYKKIYFQISIDGPDKYNHDFIRGVGSFERVLSGISQLRDHNFRFSIQTVLSQRTSQFIPDFFALAKSLGSESMNFTRFISLGHGRVYEESTDDRALKPMELKKSYEEILMSALKFKLQTSTKSALFALIDQRLGSFPGRWGSVLVDYQGFIGPSSRADIRLGHVFEEGIEKVILNSNIYKNLRSGNISDCNVCPLFYRCGGDRNAAYIENGDFLSKDPGCWVS